jgi:methylmalonyl-CoA/ethylmalonyl-CoA epimerase
MQLKYSHIDILVNDLDAAVEYFETVLGFKSSALQIWERDGFHVQFKALSNEWQRFILVQPISGNLKEMLDEKGEGTIYRFCFTSPDLVAVHRELIEKGIAPEDENGKKISEDELASPLGDPILWLPREFGTLSVEILHDPVSWPA